VTPERRTALKQAVSEARKRKTTQDAYDACWCPQCERFFTRRKTTGQHNRRFCKPLCKRLWNEGKVLA
jgi:hypothetical protein